MSPSTVGAWTNLRIFIQAQTSDMLGRYELGRLVAWSVPGLATLLVMAIVACASVVVNSGQHSKVQNDKHSFYCSFTLFWERSS